MTITLDNGTPEAYDHEAEVTVQPPMGRITTWETVTVRCACGEAWSRQWPTGTADAHDDRLDAPYLADWELHVREACGLPVDADEDDYAAVVRHYGSVVGATLRTMRTAVADDGETLPRLQWAAENLAAQADMMARRLAEISRGD